jgi:hypothetical protein
MGRFAVQKCAARGCDQTRLGYEDGVEMDVAELIRAPDSAAAAASLPHLWACCPAHCLEVRFAVAGDLIQGRPLEKDNHLPGGPHAQLHSLLVLARNRRMLASVEDYPHGAEVPRLSHVDRLLAERRLRRESMVSPSR